MQKASHEKHASRAGCNACLIRANSAGSVALPMWRLVTPLLQSATLPHEEEVGLLADLHIVAALSRLLAITKPGQVVTTPGAGIPGATDQTLGGGIQLEQDAQDVQEVVDSVEEARDNAADKAAEQLSNAADQVQSVAQAAPDAAVDRAEPPSELPSRCPALQQVFQIRIF